jgi:anti-sigma regulatory factor (Ser/Thr protein kinase)
MCRALGGGVNQIPGWSYEAVLAVEPVSASKARDFICEHLVAHDLLYLVEDIRLVVSELATNAMVHARTPFVVTLTEMNGVVRLAIRDGSAAVPVRTTPQVMDMGGRGLMLVELLSEQWGARTESDGSKSVWASFPLRTRPAPEPVLS